MREDTPNLGVRKNGDTLRDQCAIRFREAIRSVAPSMTRKKVANILGTSPETVDCWIDNERPQLPSSKHLLAAFAVFGPSFTAHVLYPCGNWTKALSVSSKADRLRKEIEDLKREIDALDPVDSQTVLVDHMRDSLAKSEEALDRSEKQMR